MTDYLDRAAFAKAMADAGVHSGDSVTAQQWLDTWERYSVSKMDTFRKFAAGVVDLVKAFRDKLRGHKAVAAAAKAELVDLETMRSEARAVGADELVLRISRSIGSLEHRADYATYDARATRRAAYALGIDLAERIDE